MVPGPINKKVITQRALWVSQMIEALKDLLEPLLEKVSHHPAGIGLLRLFAETG